MLQEINARLPKGNLLARNGMGTWKKNVGELIDDDIFHRNHSNIYKQMTFLAFLNMFDIQK